MVELVNVGPITVQLGPNPAVVLPPDIQMDDVVMLHALSRNNFPQHVYPIDWNFGSGLALAAGAKSINQSWYWKRMSGGESGSVIVMIPANDILKMGVMSVWRGVKNDGNPIRRSMPSLDYGINPQVNPATIAPDPDADPPIPGPEAGDIFVSLFSIADDNVLGTMVDGVNVESVINAYNQKSTLGGDAVLALQYARVPETGLADLGSYTMSAKDPWVVSSILLIPQP